MEIQTEFYHNPNAFEILPSICLNKVKGNNKTVLAIIIGWFTAYIDIQIEWE